MTRMRKASPTVCILIVSICMYVSRSFADLDIKSIDTVKLHALVVNNAYELEAGRERQFTVIDARTKKEYDEAHIFSSISIPEDNFETSMHLLPQDKRVLLIVYCNDAKSDISKKWAEKAAAAGYVNIAIYKAGFLIWKESKMPIAMLNGI